MRGGGGNFGIATAFEYQLRPVSRVLGGYVAFDAARAKDFLRFYRDYMAAAPDELTVEVTFSAPARPIIIAIVCYCGDPADGERVLAPLRSFGPPLADEIRVVDYAQLTDRPGLSFGVRALGVLGALRTMIGSASPPPAYDYWKGAYLARIDDCAIDTLVDCLATAPPGWSVGLGHYMHGEVCRAPEGETPLVRDCGGVSYFFNVNWAEPQYAERSMQWVDRARAAMLPYAAPGTYINYLSDGSQQGVRASYGPNYPRLVQLKDKYDPTNVFRLNRNIRPAART